MHILRITYQTGIQLRMLHMQVPFTTCNTAQFKLRVVPTLKLDTLDIK
jgi:hypothetical protein